MNQQTDVAYWESRARLLLHQGCRLVAQIDILRLKIKERGQTIARLETQISEQKRALKALAWREVATELPPLYNAVIVAGCADGELSLAYWDGFSWDLDYNGFEPHLWAPIPHPNRCKPPEDRVLDVKEKQ